jgi:uncharacterized membrane protein
MIGSDAPIILFFGLILTFIFIILPIILVGYLVSLGSRVKKLEEQRSNLELKKEVKREILLERIPEEKVIKTIQPEPKTELIEFGIINWLVEDWIMKLGALLLVVGFGFLVSYAFIYDLISPSGRIVFGLILGLGIIAFGANRIKNYQIQGDIFLVLGASVILITVIAGRTFVEFFSPVTAIATVFLTSCFISYISVLEKRPSLSYLGLIFAGLAPILSFSPATDSLNLAVYLLVVILGAIWVTYLTNIRWLNLIASLIFTLYTATLISNYQDFNINLGIVFALTAVLLVSGIISLSKQRNLIGDLITIAWSGLYLSIWILSKATESNGSDVRSLILFITSVTYIGLAFYFYKKFNSKPILYTLSSVGFLMIYNAIGLLISDDLNVVILIIEIVTLSITNYLVTKDVRVSRFINLLLIFPILFTLPSMFSMTSPIDQYYNYPQESWLLSSTEFLNLVAIAAALLGLGYFYHDHAKESKNEASIILNTSAIIIGSLYFYRIIWLFINEIFANSDYKYEYTVAISLFIYTCFGIGTYFYGLRNKAETSRIYGIVLLIIIMLRILFIDIFFMDILGRVITLLGIGTLLISTAFYSKRFTSDVRIKP